MCSHVVQPIWTTASWRSFKDSWGPGLFEFFIYLDIGILLDVELIKNIFHSIGHYSFVQMRVSSALQRPFSFMRSHLLIIDLRAYANSIMFRKVLCLFVCFCASDFKDIPHFLFHQVQCIWFYIQIFDHLELSLCRIISIALFGLLYMKMTSLTRTIFWRCCLFPLCISDFFMKNQVFIGVVLCMGLQFDSIDQCVCFCANAMLFLLL